ncbi:MAG: hypothetical protein ACKV2T_39615 [Kofleriaceae bacterium]
MQAVALVLLVVAACATAPPEKIRDPEPLAKPDVERVYTPRERPEIDIAPPQLPPIDLALVQPDPIHELRWPLSLSDHPELEPQFDIAKELAEPGVDWIELCKMGAQRRVVPKLRDQLRYLRAWCFVGANNHVAALEILVELRGTVVRGLATAIRADLTNVLVSHDPNSARSLVNKLGLRSELDVIDRLSATYIEVGNRGGANELNELALANDDSSSPSKTCQRLTRRVLLAPDEYRTSKSAFSTMRPVPGFADDPTPLLFGAKLNADPKCHELDAQLACWLIEGNCSAWYKLQGVPETDAYLLAAKAAWPTGTFRSDPDAWYNVIPSALSARPAREGYFFAVRAAEATLKLTDCDSHWGMTRLRDALSIVVNDKDVPKEMETRARWLDENKAALCFRRD